MHNKKNALFSRNAVFIPTFRPAQDLSGPLFKSTGNMELMKHEQGKISRNYDFSYSE